MLKLTHSCWDSSDLTLAAKKSVIYFKLVTCVPFYDWQREKTISRVTDAIALLMSLEEMMFPVKVLLSFHQVQKKISPFYIWCPDFRKLKLRTCGGTPYPGRWEMYMDINVYIQST